MVAFNHILPRFIDSGLRPDMPDWQLIIADNSPADNT